MEAASFEIDKTNKGL
jgi:hypothetical protein